MGKVVVYCGSSTVRGNGTGPSKTRSLKPHDARILPRKELWIPRRNITITLKSTILKRHTNQYTLALALAMSAQVNGHQVAKKTRACIQCHDRKVCNAAYWIKEPPAEADQVRCDVSNVGTPCTRCAAASNGDSCELMPPPMRSYSN